MQNTLQQLILKTTGAEAISKHAVVQQLWSGYGEIVRYGLRGANRPSVIAKQIKLPCYSDHALAQERKRHSYQVEQVWYEQWGSRCTAACRIPACLASATYGDTLVLILEDLHSAGFTVCNPQASSTHLQTCLRWLAHFHATFLGVTPTGLWPTGTYWHLATRPDELRTLPDRALQQAAAAIEHKLSASPYQTLVHGDAKLANFCFSRDGQTVAAVDFQYVGGGCGMKDVAYFIDSCLDADACEEQTQHWLDYYFTALRQALQQQSKAVDANALEQDWRALFAYAWTDFHRFLKGWSPGYWHPDSYSERVARAVIRQLQQATPE